MQEETLPGLEALRHRPQISHADGRFRSQMRQRNHVGLADAGAQGNLVNCLVTAIEVLGGIHVCAAVRIEMEKPCVPSILLDRGSRFPVHAAHGGLIGECEIDAAKTHGAVLTQSTGLSERRFPANGVTTGSMARFLPCSLSLIFILLGAARGEDPRAAFFEANVRPVLVNNCYQCHAADTKQKAGLLLDSKAGWAIGGESGPAVIPGDPDGSLIIRAVSYEEPGIQMPPKKRLSPLAIADLRQWIADGAYDPREGGAEAVSQAAATIDVAARKAEHWAWQPVSHPKPPVVADTAWPRQNVDRFILSKLEEADLRPNDEAPARVLARRVFFDLIGLPPTPEQVRAFVADPSEEAYVALVDDLLESPHFGERWGQHWLDLVRFAETWGHEQDFAIPEAWRYRDYVIRAFNADVPYHDFLTEHVAGDLLDKPRIDPERRTNESIQGTGFWHLGEATHSPVDVREDESLRISNQIDVFSKAFMGLTVMCARCHDHKFDAVTDDDYYALVGYLQSSNYQLADIADPEAQAEAYRALTTIQQSEEAALREAFTREYFLKRAEGPIDWTAAEGEPLVPLEESPHTILQAWAERETASKERAAAQTVVRTERKGELDLIPIEEPFEAARHVVVNYADPEAGWYVNGYRYGAEPAHPGTFLGDQGLVLESAAHSDLLSERFSGLLRTKTFEVVGDRLWMRVRGHGKLFVAVDSHRVCKGPLHSDRLRKEIKVGDAYQWVAHDLSKYIGHRVHLEFTPTQGFALQEVRFSKDKPHTPWKPNSHVVAMLQSLEGNADVNAGLNRVLDRAVDAWERGEADADQVALVDWAFFRSGVFAPTIKDSPRVATARARFRQDRAEAERQIPKPIRALALMDGSPENEPVHLRGNYRTLSPEPVPRRFLEALTESSDAEASPCDHGSGRLQLARQLTGLENPLTHRVMVNRVWHHLFGKGIVETVDNFGVTGTPPSHPALLDHLAHRFGHEHQGSIKALIRELVLSSTYRMSSQPDPDKTQRDPTNRLVHRMPIRRLTSEAIRDQLLSVSGRLQPDKMYGKSVMVHISPFNRTNRSPNGSGPLDGDGRRSIYIEGRRNHLEPLLVAFDKPTPFTAIGKRNVSNSPAQPLMLLNNELVHQEAARWAKHLLALPAADDRTRLAEAYWRAFSRAPEAEEIALALDFLALQRELYQDDQSEQRAWQDLAHTLINVKEFIYIP